VRGVKFDFNIKLMVGFSQLNNVFILNLKVRLVYWFELLYQCANHDCGHANYDCGGASGLYEGE
jgi:hypothetical protein